MQDMIEVTINH